MSNGRPKWKRDADRTKARAIIRAEYGDSENFMTPQVEGYELVGTLADGHTVAVERSRGEGLVTRDPIFAASFVLEAPDGETTRLHDLSEVYGSREEREELIQHVRESMDGAEGASDLYWNS